MRHVLIAAALMAGTAATAGPAARPAAPASDLLYVVRPGDTLIGLAERGLKRPADYSAVQRNNRIANPRHLRPGSTLRLPERILKTRAIAAKVAAFRGDATVSGTAARVDMVVAEGAILRTGADAFLTIALADGSRVTLPSRSLVKVTGLHRIVLTGDSIRTFDLLGGRTETEDQKALRQGDRFEIHTPVSVAAVRGTRFRVTFGEDNEAVAGTGVLEGAVAVAAGDRSVALPAGQGVTASATGPGTPTALLPKPALEHADRVQDEEQVKFTLAPLPGAATYRIQLANDAGFLEAFAEGDSPDRTVSFGKVPNGTFFARATALSADGIEGFPSVYAFERRLNAITAEVGKPESCPTRRCLRFRWRATGDGEHRYRFQLASAKGATPLFDEPQMTGSEIVLTDLPGGTYYWRVESIIVDGGRRLSKWTDYQELQVPPLRQ